MDYVDIMSLEYELPRKERIKIVGKERLEKAAKYVKGGEDIFKVAKSFGIPVDILREEIDDDFKLKRIKTASFLARRDQPLSFRARFTPKLSDQCVYTKKTSNSIVEQKKKLEQFKKLPQFTKAILKPCSLLYQLPREGQKSRKSLVVFIYGHVKHYAQKPKPTDSESIERWYQAKTFVEIENLYYSPSQPLTIEEIAELVGMDVKVVEKVVTIIHEAHEELSVCEQ